MLLSQGFEDLKAVTVIDTLGWTKVMDSLIPVDLETCTFHDEVVGKFGIRISVDLHQKTSSEIRGFDSGII